jgi:hypothetical protein
MHEFAPRESGGHRVTLKEGARPGHELGGFDDPVLLERDRHEQLVTALFKARLFMNPAQWEKYEELTMQGLNGPVRAPQEQAFRDAERRFSDYLRTMAAAMDVKLPRYPAADVAGVDQLRNAAAAKAPGSGHAAIAAQENVLMTAANRIYEDKLAVIHRLRGRLATWIGKLDAATPTRRGMIEGYIENLLQELRVLISEAAMYANEASMTDATVHHVVVGLQGGAGIEQQKSEGVNAVHENLADAMKEAGRHGPDLGHGAFKAGKYLMRMADAGKNLGFGYIWGVQMFYDLGHMISEEIKGDAEQGLVEPHAASAEAVRELAKVDTLDKLLGLAMQTAADITREYSNERIVRGGPDTQTAYGYRTVGKGERNEHLLNQDMVHPIDRDNPLALKDLAALAASGRLGVRN